MPDGFELSPSTAGEYLRDRDVIPGGVSPSARTLGGGVSNRVIAIEWDEECLVAKQPLPNLAVEDDWPADVARVHNEAAATRAYADVLSGTDLDARVPGMLFEDDDDHVIAIECAPEGADTWKAELLAGRVDADVARTVGAVLGAVHAEAAGDEELRATFASERPFEQLRLDPYHRTTARRHPDVREEIEAEIERVEGVARTLVHGDYSPKNVLVDRPAERSEGTDQAGTPWVLDFEVAHWGDPAFDTAFMCNHLFVKSVYNHERHPEYVDAAFAFWDAYDARVPWDVEAETVAELGVLMLARVDGKSPVEYVTEEATAAALRKIAKRTLRGEVETLAGFADLAGAEASAL